MRNRSRLKPCEPSPLAPWESSSRTLPQGVIAIGHLPLGPLATGLDEQGQPLQANPLPLTREVLLAGRERFNMTCALCHGRDGYGHGIIVQRGFVQPPSFHEERLRQAPPGHFFQVMTHGIGAMYSYADRISVRERWSIEYYIRALQLSQHATPGDVPAAERGKLSAETPPAPPTGAASQPPPPRPLYGLTPERLHRPDAPFYPRPPLEGDAKPEPRKSETSGGEAQ